jgi:uncharacterized membrane protein YsdA (DUF1294 family)
MGVWSLFGLLLMAEDKDQAIMQEHLEHQTRISEKTLREVALIGGFLGIMAGAKIFHRKTSKPSFWPLVVLSIFIWAYFLYLMASGDLLAVVRNLRLGIF